MTSDDICNAFAAKDQEIARLRAGLQAARADMVTTRDTSITTPAEPLADRLHASLEAVSLVLGVDVPERPEAPAEQPEEEPEPAPAPEPEPPPAPAPEPEPEEPSNP